MKFLCLIAALTTHAALAQDGGFLKFIRQTQQGSGVVWDMPVGGEASGIQSLPMEAAGAVFEMWAVHPTTAAEHLLDQQFIAPSLPSGKIRVRTLDPSGEIPRTRVDQPFTLELELEGLIPEAGMPTSAAKLLLEHRVKSFTPGTHSVDSFAMLAEPPIAAAYLTRNGMTRLRFPASSLGGADPTRAAGEESFVIHNVSDDGRARKPVATALVQVWPVASGNITGIRNGDVLNGSLPRLTLEMTDLYPTSHTQLVLFQGRSVNGNPGTVLRSFHHEAETTTSTTLRFKGLDRHLSGPGPYTLALISETVFGRELLCDPVTFTYDSGSQTP